ncbi:MAG: hypothetical protein C5B52_00710 [Bacteroidetes bacterium]|nr:MAG: hypothetical protein C5B52_00710 [Bacteroidota bacterium]
MEKSVTISSVATGKNNLFPVFIKLEQLQLVLFGGGNVGLEKLNAILQNSPGTSVRVVAREFNHAVHSLALHHNNIILDQKEYDKSDLEGSDLVIVAVNNKVLSEVITKDAHELGLLVNVADDPELCDFYLSSVVKKGNLKIAISTNGKSPTIAKRLKEAFTEMLPEELDDVLNNMEKIRKRMNGSFEQKVQRLNHITKILSVKDDADIRQQNERKWKRIATWCLFAIFFMFVGRLTLSYVPFGDLINSGKHVITNLDSRFYWMIFAGFFAQLVDGALGMGYGVTSTTILMSLGINLSAISGSVHTAEMFASGASGYSHYKFGNVNKKLFKALLIPGIIGAVIGAYLLSKYGDSYAKYIRPILAAYTLILGLRIIAFAYKKNKKPKKVRRVGWLAGAGGFLDSFGGGGWGPLVTSTLISKGRSPRYVIGSVSISEFFVTLASALTFFSMIGVSHWQIIVGLIIGGFIAAPIAAKLVGKLPLKAMFLSVGALVIISSLRILLIALGVIH